LITVAETTHYANRAAGLMSVDGRAIVIEEIARNPEAGTSSRAPVASNR
jgi:hypothetical protein